MQRPVLSLHGNARETIIPQIQHLLDDIGNIKQVPNTRLCSLMDSHGSNKNHRQHVIYTPFYHALFHDLNPELVLEFGIGSKNPSMPYNMIGQETEVGGSLRAWKDYFPAAIIVGADIDRDVLIDDERIHCFYVDATNTNTIETMWNEISMLWGHERKFQLMIDDAHHEFESNTNLFNGSISKLVTGGFYAIEDIHQTENNLINFNKWLSSCGFDAILIEIPNDTNATCSCMAIIRKT